MSGQFFLIKGCESGLVLDVQGAGEDPGTPVVLWEETGDDHQLWYIDHIDKTIRSKATNMVLDTDDANATNDLVVNAFNGSDSQLWDYEGSAANLRGMIRNHLGRVIDVSGGETDAGSRVCVWDETGAENQLFDFESQPRKYFVVISQLNGKVIEVRDGCADAETKMASNDRTDADSQLFYQDKNGLVCSKLNGFNITSAKRKNKSVWLDEESGEGQQDWVVYRDRIANKNNSNDCLQILEGADEEGAKIVWAHWHDEPHEKWRVEYV